MLVNINTANRPIDGHLAALAREGEFCSEFKYRSGAEIFGEGEEAEYVYQITSGSARTTSCSRMVVAKSLSWKPMFA